MKKKIKKDLRGTWTQAFFSFFTPILAVLIVRWIFIEPFVIPSGSMIPSLLVHDHILANKYSYGLHVPFSTKWIWQWSSPNRGDVVVFRYPNNPEVFFIKRVVAIAGDEVSVNHGNVYVNGQQIELVTIDSSPYRSVDDGNVGHTFKYYDELGHVVRYLNKEESFYPATKVPEGQFFAMGDNRDQSSDSRVWGFVPINNLIGQAKWIWLSCSNTLPSATFLCDPQSIRWNRLLIGIK